MTAARSSGSELSFPPAGQRWLCTVALCEFGWGSVEELAAASLDWLPTAPESEALYHLADDALRETTRGPDVWAWVDEVFENLGCPKPSREDFRWIATYSMVHREWSPEDAENLIRFLSSLALEAQVALDDLDEWNLLSKYRLHDFELDDGMDLDWDLILEEFRRDTKPALLERFARYFASRPAGQWVPGVLGGA